MISPLFRSKRLEAFTLIEVFTVIAIVTVVAALLFSSVKRTLDSVKETKCASNMRQLQLANNQWAADHDGQYVPVFINGENGTSEERKHWYRNEEFLVYLNATKEEVSKDLRATDRLPDRLRCPVAIKNKRDSIDVGYNDYGLAGGTEEKGAVRGTSQMKVKRPSETIAFSDAVNWAVNFKTANDYAGDTGGGGAAYRHGNAANPKNPRSIKAKANVIFFDGHGAMLSREEMVANENLWIIEGEKK